MTEILSQNFVEADEALERLRETLSDRHGRFSLQTAMEDLILFYGESDESTRYKIVSELIDTEYSGIRPFLKKVLLDDESPLLRHEAAFGLGVFKKAADIPYLTQALLSDNNEMVRHEAAIALAAIGSESSLWALELAMKDCSKAVASSAKFAIQSIRLKNQQPKMVMSG